MADIKLVGRDDIAASDSANYNYIVMTKFTANATGNVVTFKLRATGNGNVKVAIYADSAGEPGALLNSVGSTAVTAGCPSG